MGRARTGLSARRRQGARFDVDMAREDVAERNTVVHDEGAVVRILALPGSAAIAAPTSLHLAGSDGRIGVVAVATELDGDAAVPGVHATLGRALPVAVFVLRAYVASAVFARGLGARGERRDVGAISRVRATRFGRVERCLRAAVFAGPVVSGAGHLLEGAVDGNYQCATKILVSVQAPPTTGHKGTMLFATVT